MKNLWETNEVRGATLTVKGGTVSIISEKDKASWVEFRKEDNNGYPDLAIIIDNDGIRLQFKEDKDR